MRDRREIPVAAHTPEDPPRTAGPGKLRDRWERATVIMLCVALLLWAIEILNGQIDHHLNLFGIYPRTLSGLAGIPVWSLLHGSIPHLAFNLAPLMILGWLVALRGVFPFLRISLVITVVGGIGVWAAARPAYHVGSSSLVFGYFGFLVAIGIYERSLRALLIATFTLFFYGGLIFGILPHHAFVSWEGHLFGLLAGILAARLEAGGAVNADADAG